MAEELIDSYIDREGIKRDTEFIVQELNRVHNEFKKLDQVTVSLQGLKDMKSVVTSIQDVNENLKALQKTVVDLEKARQKGLDTDLKAQKVQTEQAKTAKEQARAREIEARFTERVTKEKEKLNRELIKEEEKLGKLNNAYEQLKFKYTLAANVAKQLAAAKGLDNEETKEAIAQAQKYYDSLIKIEKAVGQNQRNVGNYTQATFALTQVLREAPAFANSFATGISAISNNVPQLVDQFKLLRAETGSGFRAFRILAGSLLSFQALLPLGFLLIQSYGKELGNFFSSIFKGSKAISELERQQNLLNATTREAGRTAAQEVTRLEVLYKVATNTALSTKERKKAVDELQNLYPDYFKNVNDEIILQGKAAESYDKAKNAILEKAKTMAIESQLTKLATDELELLQKREEALRKQRDNATAQRKADASTADPELRGLEQFNAISEGTRLKAQLGQINKDLEQIAKDRKFLLDQITNAGVTSSGGTGSDPGKAIEEQLKKELDTYKIRKQALIDVSAEIMQNEKYTYEERLKAAEDWRTANELLIVTSTRMELAIGKKTKAEKENIQAQESANLFAIRVAYYNKVSDLLKNKGEEELKEEKRIQTELEKGIEDRYKRFAKAEEERTNKQKTESDKRKKLDEDEAAQKKRLTEQLVSELTALSFTLFTAGIEREKNALQEQINLLEERKQKDIEVANQTITNAQERAAAITVIEARAQADRERLQRKQRELDIKKAQFDKAQAIARIVQETAIAIVGSLKTPALIPLIAAIGAAQLAAVIAQPIPRYRHGKNTGDLYEGPAIVGDGGRPELIIRQDGSTEVTPDRPTLTYVKSRDIVLPDARAAIAAAAANETGKALVPFGASLGGYDGANVEAAIKSMEGNVVKAIKKIPQPIIRTEGIISRRILHGDNSNTYLNDNLQF